MVKWGGLRWAEGTGWLLRGRWRSGVGGGGVRGRVGYGGGGGIKERREGGWGGGRGADGGEKGRGAKGRGAKGRNPDYCYQFKNIKNYVQDKIVAKSTKKNVGNYKTN